MTFWQRLQQALQQKARQELAQIEDPETLLQQAQEEMQAAAMRNRERAVIAITQKNHLQQMVDDLQEKQDSLIEKATLAEKRGDLSLAEHWRREAAECAHSLAQTTALLQDAMEVAEQVKIMIRCEEERIRQKTAEALALRSQWQVLKIEETLVRLMAEQNAGTRRPMSVGEVASRREKIEAQAQEALAFRERLAQMVRDEAQQTEALRDKANKARDTGDERLERALVRLMEQHEATLEAAQNALVRADAVAQRAQTIFQEESGWQSLQGKLIQEGLMPERQILPGAPDRKIVLLLAMALLILLAFLVLLFLL